LIELVVVIVILGILAATAVPKFTSLTEDADKAVAQGLLAAIQSSATIQYGANQGQAVPFASIEQNTTFDAQQNAEVDLDGDGSFTTYPTGGAETCGAASSADTVDVRYDGQVATGDIVSGLCSG